MQKISRLAALLVVGATLSSPLLAAEKGGTIVTVNGQSVPKSYFDALLADQRAQGGQDTPDTQQMVREGLIRQELLVQEAKKKGTDKKADVQTQIELNRREILVRAFIGDHLRANPIRDDKLKADYEAIKASMGNKEYKTRHILVEKEEDAKAIIARLDKGEKIAELSGQSKDPGSKDRGGDLGWSAPGAYVKPFAEALVKLEKGQYTKTPVKTDFGYHVIQLDDSRALTPPAFEQVKPQLQKRAQQMQIEQLMDELRGKAKIN
jgi:peptidyl-prolyl cis-trans isomerase C